MKTKKRNSHDLGVKFEDFVAKIYADLGKSNIKKNVILKKKVKKNKIYSEFDIVYGFVFKKYVECKYHSNIAKKVSAQQVSFFAEKLKIHDICMSSGIIVTNTYLSVRARYICKMNGIKYLEREKLQMLDYERLNFYDSLKFKLKPKKETLEHRIIY